MTIVVAVVTLIPFEFDVPPRIQISFTGSASDIFTNILLFIPLGFFFQLAHGHGGWKPLLTALCFGTAVSCAVEAGQLFLPSRCSSLIDVATNGFGAWLVLQLQPVNTSGCGKTGSRVCSGWNSRC